MNTHTEYRRHSSQQPQAAQAEAEASGLARRRDPSHAAATGTPTAAQKHIAWVRPTELASYAGPMLGRGIDLHTELLRRARRAPITTTRALRHPAPTPPPPPGAHPKEGIQL